LGKAGGFPTILIVFVVFLFLSKEKGSSFGGSVVSVLTTGPKVAGSNPAKARDF
jgi:hypothetical protein